MQLTDKNYFKRLFILTPILLIGGLFSLRAVIPSEPHSRASEISIEKTKPIPATVVKKSYDKKLNLYQYRLSNNVRLNLKPLMLPKESPSEPTSRMTFRASFGRGELEMPNQEQSALAYVTNLLFTHGGIQPGVTTITDAQFSATDPDFNEHLPHLEFSVDPDDFCFKRQTNTLKQLKYLLSKMRDYFITAPIYDEEILKNNVRDALEETYNTLHSSPKGIAKDKVRRILASGNWKFGYPPKDQAMATTVDQIRSFLEKSLKNSYLELSIAGDFDVEECLKTVLQTIGTLPMRDKSRPYLKELRTVQFPKTPLEETFFLDKKEDINCDFGTIIMVWSTYTPACTRWGGWYKSLGIDARWERMNWPVAKAWGWYKGALLHVLAEILHWRLDDANKNQHCRLDRLRILSYSIPEYNNYGKFEIYARIKPEEIDCAEQILLQAIRDIRLRGISNEEFERAINKFLEKAYRKEQEIIYWQVAIDRSQELPDNLRWQKTFTETYKVLKKKDLEAIAKEILSPQNAITIKILSP